jgi:SAM-dependent methyltransferase
MEDSMHTASFGPAAWEPLAAALVAFQGGEHEALLLVHSDEGVPDPMPVSLFFRGPDEMREVDREALRLTRGRVLDGGAGVGSVTLALQDRGFEVTAVEVIPEAVEIMRGRGVADAREGRLGELPRERVYDTVLLLMNGTALAETLSGVPAFLEILDGLVAPGGQILLDSTDLLEGEEIQPMGPDWEAGEYPGELHYQVEFRGERGAPFPQLFVDPKTLARIAGGEGWTSTVCWKGEEGEYLVRLTRTAEKTLSPGGAEEPTLP